MKDYETGVHFSFKHKNPPVPCAEQNAPVLGGWHVVQVRTNAEREVQDELRLAGWQAYCPMETKWRKPRSHETQIRLSRLRERRTAAIEGASAITVAENRERALAKALRLPEISSLGRRAEVEERRAFFPGYLFVAVDEGRSLTTILETRHQPGIKGVVGVIERSDGTFARVSHGVIDRLMAAEAMGALGMTRKARRDVTAMLTRGEPVQVVGGPFDAFVGSVVRCAPNGRVKLLLDAFGVVEVDAEQVQGVAG